MVIRVLRDPEGAESVIRAIPDHLGIGIIAALHVHINVGLAGHIPDGTDQKIPDDQCLLFSFHMKLVRTSRGKRIQLQAEFPVRGNHGLLRSGCSFFLLPVSCDCSRALSVAGSSAFSVAVCRAPPGAADPVFTSCQNGPDAASRRSPSPDRDRFLLLENRPVRQKS